MLDSKLSRRGLVATATGVAAIGLLGATAGTADAYQGNMERALSSLYNALGSLRESKSARASGSVGGVAQPPSSGASSTARISTKPARDSRGCVQ